MTTESSDGRITRRGFTLIELLLVIAIIAIIASIAVPNMIQTRISANESSAVESLRMISKGMEAYKIQNRNGDGSYPSDYKALGTLNPPDIDPNLAAGQRSGYTFSGGGGAQQWSVSAVPQLYGVSGRRSFYVDATGVIRFREANLGTAGPTDSPIQ